MMSDRLGLGTTPVPVGPVFITGGSGRIGTCLRERLRPAGYDVRFTDIVEAADGDTQGFTKTDLADEDAMADAMAGCRALIHLGGHPRESEWPILQERNYTGTYNAFRAARRAGVSTIIYASSNHYCGLYPADTILTASMDPRPTGLYGASKVFGEALLRAEAEAFGITAFAWRIAAFRPAPENARELRLWLSWDDAARMIDRCLRASEAGFNIIWGVSGNARACIDDPVARRIGYIPVDDAEDHVHRLRAAGIDTDIVSEWPWLGGPQAAAWMAQNAVLDAGTGFTT